MTGLTLPEWIKAGNDSISSRLALHEKETPEMEAWLTGYAECLLALEKDMKNGLLQGVVK